jgi:hypothetical protein
MSKAALQDVIARMATDATFAESVQHDPASALAGLRLTDKERAQVLAMTTEVASTATVQLGARLSKSGLVPGASTVASGSPLEPTVMDGGDGTADGGNGAVALADGGDGSTTYGDGVDGGGDPGALIDPTDPTTWPADYAPDFDPADPVTWPADYAPAFDATDPSTWPADFAPSFDPNDPSTWPQGLTDYVPSFDPNDPTTWPQDATSYAPSFDPNDPTTWPPGYLPGGAPMQFDPNDPATWPQIDPNNPSTWPQGYLPGGAPMQFDPNDPTTWPQVQGDMAAGLVAANVPPVGMPEVQQLTPPAPAPGGDGGVQQPALPPHEVFTAPAHHAPDQPAPAPAAPAAPAVDYTRGLMPPHADDPAYIKE